VSARVLAVALGAALAAGNVGDAAANTTTKAASKAEASKKERYRLAKAKRQAAESEAARKARLRRWHTRLDKRIGKTPAKLVNIYNGWTHEYMAIRSGPRARRDLPDRDEVNRFFRCRYTNQRANMDPRLIRVLLSAANHFHSNLVTVISGYRSHKYNLLLRKKGRQVARRSQHTLGKAVDFALRRVPTTRLHKWAVDQKLGGVGLYRTSGFIHMDTGRVRFWEGR
jgi:uncharacterized protein YcbK (DUF882 family)